VRPFWGSGPGRYAWVGTSGSSSVWDSIGRIYPLEPLEPRLLPSWASGSLHAVVPNNESLPGRLDRHRISLHDVVQKSAQGFVHGGRLLESDGVACIGDPDEFHDVRQPSHECLYFLGIQRDPVVLAVDNERRYLDLGQLIQQALTPRKARMT